MQFAKELFLELKVIEKDTLDSGLYYNIHPNLKAEYALIIIYL